MTLHDILSTRPQDHEEGRRLAWLREKLGIRTTAPIITIATNPAQLAAWQHAEVQQLAAVVLNRFRAHGDPEDLCKALEPSLVAALGAWLGEHFISAEEATPPS